MGPNALRYSEQVLAILRAGGVPDDLAVSGYLLLFAVVNGFTMDETAEPVPVSGDAEEPPSPSAVSGYLGSLPPSQFPNLTAVASHFAVGITNSSSICSSTSLSTGWRSVPRSAQADRERSERRRQRLFAVRRSPFAGGYAHRPRA